MLSEYFQLMNMFIPCSTKLKDYIKGKEYFYLKLKQVYLL